MTGDAIQELDAMRAALTALEGLDDSARVRALKWVGEMLGVSASLPGGPSSSSIGQQSQVGPIAEGQGTVGVTPKQFMALKKPLTDVERIACLAYYLTYERDTLHFKTKDLTSLNTEAAGLRFGNAAQAAKNAMTQSAYLAQAGKGSRQITPRGEAVVEALPDREAVKAALDEHPKRRRAARRAARKPKAA